MSGEHGAPDMNGTNGSRPDDELLGVAAAATQSAAASGSGSGSNTTGELSARDWREAWRAARDSNVSQVPPRVQAPAVIPERHRSADPSAGAAPKAAPPTVAPPAAAPPTAAPPAVEPSAPVVAAPEPPARPKAPEIDRSVANEPRAEPVSAPSRPQTPDRPTESGPAEPAQWMPSGHAAPATSTLDRPGGLTLPGSDPDATTPPMAVGAALAGTAQSPQTDPAEAGWKARFKSFWSPQPVDPTGAEAAPRTPEAAPVGRRRAAPAAAVTATAAAATVAPAPGVAGGSPSTATAPPPPPGFGPTPPGQTGPVAVGAPAVAAAGGLAVAASASMTDQTTRVGGARTGALAAPAAPVAATPSGRRAASAPPPAQRPATSDAPPRRTGVRRAHLKLTRVDPWTVMKVSFMLAIAFGIMTVVSVTIVWSMLDAAGVFAEIGESVSAVTGDPSDGGGFDIMQWFAFDRVIGFTLLLAVVDVVLITALATLFAFLYNLASSLLGGVEVTLVEDNR